jgi:hypothetical protein
VSLKYIEMNPALADKVGVNYRNRAGNVADALANADNLVGRYEIRPRKP